MAGYSGTPLVKKLGIKPGARIFLARAPKNYLELVAPLPKEAKVSPRLVSELDFVHIFSTSKSHLDQELRKCLSKLKRDGAIWVSWPKKSANVSTEVGENEIRSAALPLGLVDIKVCAVNETWSGLKLVMRKQLRVKR